MKASITHLLDKRYEQLSKNYLLEGLL